MSLLCCDVNPFNPRREAAVSLLHKDRINIDWFFLAFNRGCGRRKGSVSDGRLAREYFVV